MLLLSCPVQWRGSCPTHPTAVLASTAVMPRTVPRQVCGVWCVGDVCLWCSCGGVSSVRPPPRRGGGWGHRGWWGGIADGGWHGEGRAAVLLTPRRMSASPRLCVGVPLVVYPVALLNGGSGVWWCDAPCSDWVLPFTLSVPLVLPLLFFSSPPHRLCSPSRHVGLVLCLCDRVMSLWNSGDGLCWVEGCVVSTVYTSSVLWCASQWCACCDGRV